ncbi:MAG: bifunctional class I SAM-dependent methyltransferase/glycosyltransferase family 2 protein [Pseudomonadota bacterium]
MSDPRPVSPSPFSEASQPADTGKADLRAFFDGLASAHDTWRRRHRLYYTEQTAVIRRFVDPGLRVLEVGCGTGDTLAAMQPAVGLGLDLSPAMIDRARRKHPGLRFEVMDAEQLDLGGETFDVVVMADLVGELHDLWAAFRALRKVVRPHTRIIITYYNFLWQPLIEVAQRLGIKRPQMVQNWFTLDDIENLFSLNGFERVTSGDRLLLPVPVPGLETLANRVGAALPGLHALNLLQYQVLRPGPAFDARAQPLSCSVIVPAKNERGNIRPAIRRTPRMGPRTELIFVEGGSSDGTREEILAAIADEKSPCTLRFVPQGGKGKGDAVRTGFAEATGDVLMILDADLTVMPEDLPRFYLAIAEGRGEFINGCRLVYPQEDQAMRTLNLIANKFFGNAFSYVLNQRLKDTLCGTKVLTRDNYQRIADNRHVFGEFDPFGDFDLLFGAARLGLRIVEMPVRYRARTYGSTQIQRFRHGLLLFEMLGMAAHRFRFNRSFRPE